ncbi:hypothetical protein EJB05_47486, partial [Eragrostis curvula]
MRREEDGGAAPRPRLLRLATDGGDASSSSSYRKLYSFHHAVSGFAVHATASLAERLRAAPEVTAVEEDTGTRPMTTYTPRLLGLPGGVWRRRRRDDAGVDDDEGEGVVVGVDPAHPSFAYVPRVGGVARGRSPLGTTLAAPGPCSRLARAMARSSRRGTSLPARRRCFDLTPRVTCRRSTLKDTADARSPLLQPRCFDRSGEQRSACGGRRGILRLRQRHGTKRKAIHQPLQLAVYKAVYPAGGTMVDLIAAIDQAIEDKVDVLVLSVGPDARPGSKVTFLSMLDVASLSARRAGVFVVQAAGNRGPAESSVVSYSPWVMTVGAGTTGRSYTARLVLGDDRRILGLGLSAPTLQHRLVAAKDAAVPDAADMERAGECQDAEALRARAELLHGTIVLCSFSQGFYNGTSKVTAILDVAEALGFAGFVLVADARYGDFVAQPLPFRVPGLMVIWSYYAEHTVYAGIATVFGAAASIAEGRVVTFTDAAPVVARYSSRGPDVADNASTPADVLKPDILAPGDQVWAAWSALRANEPILAGDHFAMVSGTSMAAPHVAGIAALVKHRHPSWGPSAIASALSTTARRHDDRGAAIMAEGFETSSLRPGTAFDYGAGFVNPAGALDPELVIAPEDEDYIGFLCSLPQLSADDVRSATGAACQPSPWLASPADLNLPSITVAALRRSLSVRRTVWNVASKNETYLCSVLPPAGVDVTVRPGWFEVAPGGTQEVVVELTATSASGAFSFGEVVLTGSLDQLVRLPLAVRPLAIAAEM